MGGFCLAATPYNNMKTALEAKPYCRREHITCWMLCSEELWEHAACVDRGDTG
jgi:hypothetical protein